jgi:hypothetical protein
MCLSYSGVTVKLFNDNGQCVGSGFVEANMPEVKVGDEQNKLAFDLACEKFKDSDEFKKLNKGKSRYLDLRVMLTIETQETE